MNSKKSNEIPSCVIQEVGPGGVTMHLLRNGFVPLESIKAFMDEHFYMDGTLNQLLKEKLPYVPPADLDAAIKFLSSPKGNKIIEEERRMTEGKMAMDIRACTANRKGHPHS